MVFAIQKGFKEKEVVWIGVDINVTVYQEVFNVYEWKIESNECRAKMGDVTSNGAWS